MAAGVGRHRVGRNGATANLGTKILDFRGLDSSRILILRGDILMSIGNIPEVLSQRILAGIILVGRLGVSSASMVSVVPRGLGPSFLGGPDVLGKIPALEKSFPCGVVASDGACCRARGGASGKSSRAVRDAEVTSNRGSTVRS